MVLFDRNTMDHIAYVAGARAWSDAMQPHLAARFVHALQADGGGSTRIDPGKGSAPALRMRWRPADHWDDAPWQPAFGTREALLRFLTCQDEAIARTCDGRWARTRIALPVDPASLQPLRTDRHAGVPAAAGPGRQAGGGAGVPAAARGVPRGVRTPALIPRGRTLPRCEAAEG